MTIRRVIIFALIALPSVLARGICPEEDASPIRGGGGREEGPSTASGIVAEIRQPLVDRATAFVSRRFASDPDCVKPCLLLAADRFLASSAAALVFGLLQVDGRISFEGIAWIVGQFVLADSTSGAVMLTRCIARCRAPEMQILPASAADDFV